MFNYGYRTESAMLRAIAERLKTAVTVVRYLLKMGNGSLCLNGYRVETFHTREMGFYFLCD